MQIRTFKAVDEIPKAGWRELVRDLDIGYSLANLRYREAIEPGATVILTVEDTGGLLMGALIGYVARPETPVFSDPLKLLRSDHVLRKDDASLPTEGDELREARDALLALDPAFVVTNLADSRVLVDPRLSGSLRQGVVESLISAAKKVAQELGCGSVAFLYVPDDDRFLDELRDMEFDLTTCSGRSTLELDGVTSRDQYLDRLPSRRRRTFVREWRGFRDAGLEIVELDPDRDLDRIAALEVQTYARHGDAPPHRQVAERLRRQQQHAGAFVRLVGCRGPQGLIAAGVHLVGRTTYYCTTYGFDHAAAAPRFAYQAMGFYEPLAFASARGLGRVFLGMEALDPKLSRGGTLQSLQLALWTSDQAVRQAAEPWLAFIDSRNRDYLGRLASKYTPAAPPEGILGTGGR